MLKRIGPNTLRGFDGKTFPHYEVIQSRRWYHKPTGRTASIYGAQPWTHPADKDNWELQTVGWTVRDNVQGTVGFGRVPFQTESEANEFVCRLLSK
jgi:hypothetical protein